MDRDRLIADYFWKNYSYKEISACLLSQHEINISVRQVKRVLQGLGLSRRLNKDSEQIIAQAIQIEVSGMACNLGYRSMHQRLSNLYHLKTDRETVRKIMKEADPVGVMNRSIHRLKRRQYYSMGPNYCWHLDGYDKLQPYGFCIHGCIDGYSRKMLWLEVTYTNNNPEVIASYFVNYIASIKGTARQVRGDCGTENCNVAGIQRYFRGKHTDECAGEKSFIYGKSTSNQRIEAWWSKLRQATTQYWIEFFSDMRERNEFREDGDIFRECLRFCFTRLIQKHLNQTRQMHNDHRIRRYNQQNCPSGKPNILYNTASAYGANDWKYSVPDSDIEVARTLAVKEKLQYGCANNFYNFATEYMRQNNLTFPITAEEARDLYLVLCTAIDTI